MRTVISDPDDPRVADYLHLTDPAPRMGFFIVEGWEAVVRLLRTDWPVRSVLIAADKVDRLEVPAGVPLYVASREVLAATVGFQLHRGVVAAVDRRPVSALADLLSSSHTLAVLEGLNDHENLGAIFRSAVVLGIDGVVLDPTCADPFYRRCVRVSMGTVLTIPIARSEDWLADLALMKQSGFTVVALTPHPAARDIGEVEVAGKPAVLMGSEATGLTTEAMAAADMMVRIPQSGDVDSLNVGHAAAIAFYRFGRR
jgi:tRNA G18 (ribose-2'-O)-methylase SpoU